jgi:hypothetical protein
MRRQMRRMKKIAPWKTYRFPEGIFMSLYDRKWLAFSINPVSISLFPSKSPDISRLSSFSDVDSQTELA